MSISIQVFGGQSIEGPLRPQQTETDRERNHFSTCQPLDAIYLLKYRDLGREGCNARDLSETIL